MDPTKNRNGTPDQERAESKILKTGKAYQSRESWANGNPGPFHDPHIAAYLARHARELSGDPIELRDFFLASYAYGKFQRLRHSRMSALRLASNSACVPPISQIPPR